MPYPEHLLPQPNYRIIEWHEGLRNCFLLRSAPTRGVVDPETGKVRAKYVNDGSREQLKDYSTNLVGVFRPEDAAVRIEKTERKAYLTGHWTPGEVVEPPTVADFSIQPEHSCFYYQIGEIQDYPQPFSIANLPGYVGQCYVLHTPTRSNFWHFSVRWKLGEQDVEEALSESERRNLLGLVRSFLIERAILLLPSEPTRIASSWHTT